MLQIVLPFFPWLSKILSLELLVENHLNSKWYFLGVIKLNYIKSDLFYILLLKIILSRKNCFKIFPVDDTIFIRVYEVKNIIKIIVLQFINNFGKCSTDEWSFICHLSNLNVLFCKFKVTIESICWYVYYSIILHTSWIIYKSIYI